jgi:hypothetical protein
VLSDAVTIKKSSQELMEILPDNSLGISYIMRSIWTNMWLQVSLESFLKWIDDNITVGEELGNIISE